MLKLKPSVRMNRRYLLIKGRKEDIEKAILDYVGILGWAKASPVFVKTKNDIVLAIDRKELDNIKGAFAIFPEKIQVVKVSETLKRLG